MDTLSGLDASFLYIETPETPMHVGSFSLYALPPDFKGSWHQTVKAHIAKRLHLVPIFSRKLQFMPLDLGHPAWIQVNQVDLDFHIQRVKGGTLTVSDAEAVCAERHGHLMDRSQPLWEFHVFDRIQQADGSLCAGLYTKIHHAALDGKGGTVLTQAITDLTATPREHSPNPRGGSKTHTKQPTLRDMMGSVFSNSKDQYTRLLKALPHAARAFGSTLLKQSRQGAGQQTPRKSLLRLAPITEFNVAIGAERTFGTVHLPFADCRDLAHALNASFNDIVLWICATALRTYMANHGGVPSKAMLAAMPISLREEGNQELNTQASMTVVELGTQCARPHDRLQAIMASTAKIKTARAELKGLIPTDYPSLLAPWLVGSVTKAAFKIYSATGLSRRLPMMANLVISNVPGPQVPLYMAGARMLTYSPLSIVIHGMALNITIQTYAGSVDFGVVADKKAVPDAHEITHALQQAYDESRKLLAPQDARLISIKRPASKKRLKTIH